MESKDVDKLFRDAFEHAEETPSPSVWSNIEKELAQEKKVIPFHKKYRAQLSIAAMFLLFFGVGLSFYMSPVDIQTEKIDELLSSMEKENNESRTTSSSSNSVESNIEVKIEKQSPKPSNNSMLAYKNDNEAKEVVVTKQKVLPTDEVAQQRTEHLEKENIIATVDVEIVSPKLDYEELVSLPTIKEDVQNPVAFSTTKEEVKSSIITRVLNGITKNIITKSIDIDEKREIEFKNDEEGSITINILNSLAKN